MFVNLPGQSPLIQGIHIGIRVKLLYGKDTRFVPLASEQHHSTNHGRDTGGVADGLTAYLTVALLMVTDIVDIGGFLFAVLSAGENTANVGFSLGAWT